MQKLVAILGLALIVGGVNSAWAACRGKDVTTLKQITNPNLPNAGLTVGMAFLTKNYGNAQNTTGSQCENVFFISTIPVGSESLKKLPFVNQFAQQCDYFYETNVQHHTVQCKPSNTNSSVPDMYIAPVPPAKPKFTVYNVLECQRGPVCD